MAIPQAQFAPWTRKHDEPGNPLFSQVATILFPQSLEDLIEICKNRPASQRLRAAGSHWALSAAAISDHTFIETHDPKEFFPAMGRTLRDVVPGCLSDAFLTKLNNVTSTNAATGLISVPPSYFVHFESGKRVYQLYAELDRGDSTVPNSLAVLMQTKFGNNKFLGSWGFSTLGGAGGQTVVGALSTGTHGGDFERPPIADSVVALHVVLDGGKHLWIERGTRSDPFMTDPQKLVAHFGQAKFGGPQNFEVLYSDAALNAAMIQVGRFGVVYSAVLMAEPQYGLREELVSDSWENVKDKIADPNSDLFIKPLGGTAQRFLQIAVNPVPLADGTKHQAGVMRRWTVPVATLQNSVTGNVSWGGAPSPKGRPERVGNVENENDPMLKSPRFAHAGNQIGFAPDEDTDPLSLNLLDAACADANFIIGIIEAVIGEIEDFIDSNGTVIGGSLGAAAATGLGAPVLVELIPLLLLILAFLLAFLAATQAAGQSTLGDVFDDLRGGLLNDPVTRPAGILVWRAIVSKVWESQQSPHDYAAISYAIMDTHNYRDLSCAVNVRSLEVFFDAADPALVTFVDRLLKFEIDQEFQHGHSVAGYVSLRFCGQTSALIGQERFARTVAIECSGLADVNGSIQFVDFAEKLALDPNIKGILHWGQQNTSTQAQVEFRFGDSVSQPGGPLHTWRGVLATLTENGRLDGFSSEFTRRAGLEVVKPKVGNFAVTTAPTATHHACTVSWDCDRNPPGTTVRIEVHPPSGSIQPASGLALHGSRTINKTVSGVYQIKLIVSLTFNGETRKDELALNVNFP